MKKAKAAWLHFRADADLGEQIHRIADREQLALSEVVRRLLVSGLRQADAAPGAAGLLANLATGEGELADG